MINNIMRIVVGAILTLGSPILMQELHCLLSPYGDGYILSLFMFCFGLFFIGASFLIVGICDATNEK